MKNKSNATLLCICFLSTIFSQSLDSLNLSWEASVNFGTYGQRTVDVNDTLWHFGGLLRYGLPYGYVFWDHSFMEYMAPGDNYWTIDTTKIIYRRWFNAETYNGKIYIFGGIGFDGFTNNYIEEVEIFDPTTRTISYGTPLPNPRRSSGSVIYEGKLYLIGGSNAEGYSEQVDIYDIDSNIWYSATSLPIPLETEASYYNGKIYVIGGYNGTAHDEIFEYDITNDVWNQVGYAPATISAHKMLSFNGQIFVIGDYSILNRIWSYNIEENSWTNYSSNIIGRRHASLVVSNDKLFVIAGNSSLDGTYQYYKIVQSIDLTPFLGTSSNDAQILKGLSIKQNYPNPFNPTTNIEYTIGESGKLKICIFNIKGGLIKEIANDYMNPGTYLTIWDGKTQNGIDAASGEYIVMFEINNKVITKKILLLK